MKKIAFLVTLFLMSCNQSNDKLATDAAADSTSVENHSVVKDASNLDLENSSKNEKYLIIPGKSIGDTHILDDVETLEKLGKPSFSDAAMGKAWTVWTGEGLDVLGNRTTLAIYTTYNGSDMSKKVVKKIRITSADFETAEGAHTGMTFSEISSIFSNLRLDSQWQKRDDNVKTTFYSVANSGIGFEFQNIQDRQICVAIIVAAADEISNFNYLILDSDQIQQ